MGREPSSCATYVRADTSRMGWGWRGVGQKRSCYAVYVWAATSNLGGVGVAWGKNVHVTLHESANDMCCYVTHGVRLVWGGARTFMLRCVCTCCHVTHGVGVGGVGQNRSSYAAYVRAATSRMGWGWVGWGQNVSCYAACCYMVGLGWGGVGK